MRQSFTSIALKCRIPGYDDPKVDVLSLVKRWLDRKDQGWWVMVLDNADDAQLFFPPLRGSKQEEGYLGQCIPECAHGSILITTRNKQAGRDLAKGRPPIEINAMYDGESEQLLCANLGEMDVASDKLLGLSSRLENLPLALVQAAAFIEANTMAVDEYLHLLDKSNQNLVALLSEEFETVGRDSETPCAVAETWILSFEQIQKQSAFAGELFSLMSFFDRQSIPVEFLADYGKQQEGRGEIQLQKALGVLKAFCFVTAGKDQSLDVHRLVQLVSRKWLARKKKTKHFASQALLAVSHVYPHSNYKNWVTCSKFLPHVYQVLKFEGTGSRDKQIGKGFLLRRMATYFQHQGQWKDAERFHLETIELLRAVLGSVQCETLNRIACLASAYQIQGRWEEAEKLEVQVMEAYKMKLGADHSDTLSSMAIWQQHTGTRAGGRRLRSWTCR